MRYDVVFEHEVIFRGLVGFRIAQRSRIEFLGYDRFVVAPDGVALFIVADHADLRHSNRVGVHCRSRVERVEYFIEVLRRENESILGIVVSAFAVVVTARSAQNSRAGNDSRCRQHTYPFDNFFIHSLTP